MHVTDATEEERLELEKQLAESSSTDGASEEKRPEEAV